MPVSMPAGTPRSRFMLWSAHQLIWAWIILLSSSIVDSQIGSTVLGRINVVLFLMILWMMYAHQRHGMVLCPLCANAVPLDGGSRAAARASTLRWAHRTFSLAYMIVEVIVLTGTVVMSFIYVTRVPLSSYLICSISAVEAYLMRVHQPLQRWCPDCRWDGHGDHEVVPDPVPPSGVVVVT